AVHRLVVLEHGQKSPWLTESSNIGGCEVVGDGSAVEIDQSLPVIAQQRSGHSFRVVLDRPHIAHAFVLVIVRLQLFAQCSGVYVLSQLRGRLSQCLRPGALLRALPSIPVALLANIVVWHRRIPSSPVRGAGQQSSPSTKQIPASHADGSTRRDRGSGASASP